MIDVDECAGKPCQQICHNFPGSFACSCKRGFKKVDLDPKSKQCVPVDSKNFWIIKYHAKYPNKVGRQEIEILVQYQNKSRLNWSIIGRFHFVWEYNWIQ